MGPADRYQPEGAVPHVPGIPAGHDRGARRLHRQHSLHGGRARRPGAGGLLRGEGRPGAAHPQPGHRPRAGRSAGQLRVPRPDRHRDGRLDPPGPGGAGPVGRHRPGPPHRHGGRDRRRRGLPGLGRGELLAGHGSHGRRRGHGLTLAGGSAGRGRDIRGRDMGADGTAQMAAGPSGEEPAMAPAAEPPAPPEPAAPPARRRASRLIDIAAAAGVHVSTVSRVLNGDPALSIRPETYERVLGAARAQGYRPNALARALKQSRTGALAMVVPLLRNPIWTRLQRGALQQARERGYVVMIMEELTEEPRPPGDYRYLVEESRVDGLLLATALRVPEHHALVKAIPHVYVNRRGPDPGNDVVMDEAGAV